MSVRIVFTSVLVVLSPVGLGAEAQRCLGELKVAEGLPPGYQWTVTEGPDFDVFRAQAPDKKSGVAVYLGYHGWLSPTLLAQDGQLGKFAEITVRWYIVKSESGEFEALTFVEGYKHGTCWEPINIQPTVFAEDEAVLQELIRTLSRAKIIGPACEEPNKPMQATREDARA